VQGPMGVAVGVGVNVFVAVGVDDGMGVGLAVVVGMLVGVDGGTSGRTAVWVGDGRIVANGLETAVPVGETTKDTEVLTVGWHPNKRMVTSNRHRRSKKRLSKLGRLMMARG